MSKEIGGCIEVPYEITMDEVSDAFIAFIESKGCLFYRYKLCRGISLKETVEKKNKDDIMMNVYS